MLDGKSYEASRRSSEGFVRFAGGEFTWRGKIFGAYGWSGDVILTVKGQAMSGLIYSPEAVYEIVPQENFRHLLVQIDQSRFQPCGGAIPAKSGREITEERTGAPTAFDDGSQIDVMIVYTAAVRSALGGTTQSEAFAQQAVSTTNTVYQNSGIATRLRLVRTMEVSYADNGTGKQGLDWVTGDATVAAARDAAKADMVALLTENANDICGIAWIMTNVGPGFASAAFSLTQRTCAIGGLTFAHELGHNQACDHNPENATLSASELAYPYAFGHWDSGADFRTVMSYSNPCPGCARIPYFSNPSITHNGVPIGIANQRDNTRVINNTALTISQFRDSGGGGGGCTYGLNPPSRSFTSAGGSSSFSVTTGGTCSWTATVNAPASSESSSPLREGGLIPSLNDSGAYSGPETTPIAAQDVFLNSTSITINDRPGNSNPPGTGSAYPSTISVSGMTGTITKVDVALNSVSHTFPDDVDVLLVGPGGQRVILMSDAGGSAGVSGVNLTFDQSAAAMPDASQIVSGTYRPTNFSGDTTLEPGGVDNFPSPGPGQTNYGSDLSVFNGTAPNGTWRLYVVDDEAGDSGSIATGWALGITTGGGGTSWITITSGSSGTGNGTVSYTVAANSGSSQRTGTITVNGQAHTVTQAGNSGGGCPSTAIAPGQTISGSLTTSDCIFTGTTRYVDVYGFSGTAGQRVAVSMSSSAFDTYLYLVDSSNQILGEDDDGADTGTNSRIPAVSGFFTLPATGSYSIWATSYSQNSTGAYSISLVNETACAFSISPTSRSFSSPGGNSSFSVSTASGCAWSAASSASWITTSSSGTGNGTVSYTVAANSGSSQRTGTITAGGKTHTVTQSGAPATVQVTVQTNPSGRSFTVDGTSYTSAQTFSWTSGSSHTIATGSPQNGTAGTRYVWGSWSDGGAISHSVAPTGNATYTATFATQHFLTMSAGAGGTVSPASGWHNRGAGVSISATPNSGFSFGGWTGSGSGSFTGSTNPASVTMNGPVSETASFSASGGNAVYDSVLKALKCGQVGSACNSGALLNGRGTMTGGLEPNQPNTINNSCADGTSGNYHVDESIDAIKVSTVAGGDFAPGRAVKVEVTVWSWSTSSDYLDLYYAGNASSPNWVYLATLQPQATGSQVLTTTYTLPAGGSLQAVRARFRFQGSASSCGTGSFDDHDDLVFATTPSLNINNAAVTEGNAGTTNATFTVSLSGATSREVRVNYQTANGSAVAGSDYQTTQGQLVFSPGQTSKSVLVPVIGNTLSEPSETFLVNLSAPVNAVIADAQGVGTITDNDVSTRIRVNNVTVTERNTGVNVNAIFTVSLTAASQQTVTVRYATANGTALATADYGARSLTTLTFLPGQISKTVAVQVRGDLLDEVNETFKLVLSSPTNATLYVTQGVCTIIDNDSPPSVTISNVSVTEPDTGAVAAAFAVTLSAPSGRPVSVKYQTAPGTAASGVDYTALALTTLTFQPGQTSRTVNVQVRGDTAAESNETFFVNLSAPVNATIADAQGLGTITNDD
ncbi:MAG TPA: Calx-beta domain-containing protein [Pyrinomonadaceae bacterium]|nr:Calx-beta domain-containing protein [Pyrinomonadaceae bacterium]